MRTETFRCPHCGSVLHKSMFPYQLCTDPRRLALRGVQVKVVFCSVCSEPIDREGILWGKYDPERAVSSSVRRKWTLQRLRRFLVRFGCKAPLSGLVGASGGAFLGGLFGLAFALVGAFFGIMEKWLETHSLPLALEQWRPTVPLPLPVVLLAAAFSLGGGSGAIIGTGFGDAALGRFVGKIVGGIATLVSGVIIGFSMLRPQSRGEVPSWWTAIELIVMAIVGVYFAVQGWKASRYCADVGCNIWLGRARTRKGT